MPQPTPAPLPNLPTGMNATPIPGGYRIKTVGDWRIDVVIFTGSARISTSLIDSSYGTWQDVYCYYGAKRLMNAVMSANIWSGEEGTEPEGYDRAWHA